MSSSDANARGSTTSATPWWPSNPASAVSDPPSSSTIGMRSRVAWSTSFSSGPRRCGTTNRRRAGRPAANASSTGRRPATSSSSGPMLSGRWKRRLPPLPGFRSARLGRPRARPGTRPRPGRWVRPTLWASIRGFRAPVEWAGLRGPAIGRSLVEGSAIGRTAIGRTAIGTGPAPGCRRPRPAVARQLARGERGPRSILVRPAVARWTVRRRTRPETGGWPVVRSSGGRAPVGRHGPREGGAWSRRSPPGPVRDRSVARRMWAVGDGADPDRLAETNPRARRPGRGAPTRSRVRPVAILPSRPVSHDSPRPAAASAGRRGCPPRRSRAPRARRGAGRRTPSHAPPGPPRAPRATPDPSASRPGSGSGRIASTWSRSRRASRAHTASALESARRSIRRLSSRTRSNSAASAADTFRSSSSAAPKASRATVRASVRVGIVRAILAVCRKGGDQGVEPLDRGGGRGQRLVGVTEAGPVVDGDQREPEGARRDPALQQLGDAGDVPGRLGHLGAVHPEVGAMQPGSDERLPGRRLALGDLVLVVRERPGRRRPCGCRTTRRGGPCSSPSIRCASRGGRGPRRSPTTARRAWDPSTARSRGRRPCRTRRPRPAPPP